MTHRILLLTFAAFFLFSAAPHAQQEVRKEAPPEIRQLIAAVVGAVNGTAENFEVFAQERFAAELLKQQSASDRAALHRKLSETFGEVAVGAVRREGPGGPLLLQVKGSKSNGVIAVELDSSTSPKIVAFDTDEP